MHVKGDVVAGGGRWSIVKQGAYNITIAGYVLRNAYTAVRFH